MKLRPTLNVRALPTDGFGTAEPLWWGVLSLTIIEGIVMVLAVVVYYYVALSYGMLPPSRILPPSLLAGTVSLVVFLASIFPMYRAMRCAEFNDKPATKMWLGISLLLMVVLTVIRYFEFHGLHVRWDTTAYGSAVWGLLGLHTFHLVTTVGETALVYIWALKAGLAPKHRLDVEVGAIYWYFVVITATMNFVVIYLSPYLMKY